MSLSNHTFILKNNGTLWGCGNNSNGQLGLRDTTNRLSFSIIGINTNDIKSVYCGYGHTFILKNDGTLWGCGGNGYGELGLGDTNNRNIFTQITTNVNNIKAVYCGNNHTIILKNDDTLWGSGYNRLGHLGLGDTTNRNMFTKIATDIKSAYCGSEYTVVLKNDGTLWACGYNNCGQLGLGDTNNRTVLTRITTTTNTNDIKLICCGDSHTLILKNNGTLWACGDNQYGQLGLGDTNRRTTFTQITANTNDIKSVYCGGNYTSILKNDGTLYVCGANVYGQLGLGDTTNRKTLTQVTTNTDDIKSIYCGYNHNAILKNDGTLYVCGLNDSGKLGLGDTSNRKIFTKTTTNTNDIKCFANNYNIPNTIKIYDLKVGYIETIDTNNFRNIPVDKFEKLKFLYTNPVDTYLNCLISFDKKQTWKTFDGLNWNIVSDDSPQNIISNGMELIKVSQLNKSKLIAGGFTGDLDFKIAMKTNDKTVTSSVTKIYIEYK